jgi:chromosome segregation ATPase
MEEMKKRLEQDIAEIKKKVEEQEAGERGAREEAARTSDTYHLHIRQKQERERKLTTAKSAVVRLSEQVAQLEREIRGLRQGVEHGT